MENIYGIIWLLFSSMILVSFSFLIILTMYRTSQLIISIPPKDQRTGDPDTNSYLWIPIIIGIFSLFMIILYYSPLSIIPAQYRFFIWLFGILLYISGFIILFFIGKSLRRNNTSHLSQSQLIIGIISAFLPFIILSFSGTSIVNGILDILPGTNSNDLDIIPSSEIFTILIMSAPIISGLYASLIFGKLM